MKINLEEAEPREPDWDGLEAAVNALAQQMQKRLDGMMNAKFEDDILDAEFIE